MIKRDVTVHRKLKMGLLLDRLLDWCRLESARATQFATTTVADVRLQRRAREMERQDLLTEYVFNRHIVAFMLGDTPQEAASPDIVFVRAVPASRPYDADQRRRHEDLPASVQLGLHTARMKTMGMPSTGWEVKVRELSCSCRFHKKFLCCTHVLFALNTRGHIDLFGRERLVYRGTTKNRRVNAGRQGAGRPPSNEPALAIN